MRVTHRILAAAVALAYLAGYLLVFAHHIEEQHVECVEHGVAHHGEAQTDTDAEQVPDGISALEHGDHEHCSLTQVVRSHTPDVAPGFTPTLQDVLVAALNTPATGVDLPRLAVWRYAPKQSPPSID